MQTFSQEIREQLYKGCRGYCQIPGCTMNGTEFHHRIPNTKGNQKKFPLFLQSPFNAFLICKAHHENYSTFPWLKITEKQAEVYESYLKGLKNAQ
jgi:hypothetical protein